MTIGGIVSVLLGSLFLFREQPCRKFCITFHRSIIIASTAVTALFFLFVVGMGLKAQRIKPATGIQTFIGKTGEAIHALNPIGTVKVNGEIWNAQSFSGKYKCR